MSTTQLPIENKIAPIGKSYSALDFLADVVVSSNGGAVYELCSKSIANFEFPRVTYIRFSIFLWRVVGTRTPVRW